MTLFLTMLPLYLLGNFHCMGMCGPLVMMIGKHRYRNCYFIGRLTSFSLAGLIAGQLGAVLDVLLREYQIPAITCFLYAAIILIVGVCMLIGRRFPGEQLLARLLSPANKTLSQLMLRDRVWPTFLFGFFTVALPCGQTVIVFSACALAGDPLVGWINGLTFALLTTPSLWVSMHAHRIFKKGALHYNKLMGTAAVLIGLVAVCRGLAEVGVIPHVALGHYLVFF